ncbi:DUF2520 domain-containing protein [Ruegeria sp. 2205SS24-7]|uniref:Rossmann-like and DUF2520 domain-containing protein n=1 Tax=Ruegeria discodermiae TaxID=3064389 RepID=UPI002740C77E|nr:Rossmann-like and DUF2520 domain-containing protein [Ruegeria sp. 2205SS24-7]MDP5220732.1 DUF2520 domain-containing protein [Ruegeria sp. 2205SS24-7]
MAKTKVNLIGAGRVGQTLLGLLRRSRRYAVQDILSSRLSSAEHAVQFAGTGRALEHYADLAPAELWILAVPDSQISVVAAEIAKAFEYHDLNEPPPVVFHCSGFFPADQMAPLQKLGWRLASVHPALTFAEPVTSIQQFEGTLCGVEGESSALELVEDFLDEIGAIPFRINSESKSLYHAAAVISNNFAVVLQAIAREAWAKAGVPDDIAKQLNTKLLQATCENVVAYGPLGALTGPASRGDTFVVAQQGKDVAAWHPAAGIVYKELSLLAQKLKTDGKTQDGVDSKG